MAKQKKRSKKYRAKSAAPAAVAPTASEPTRRDTFRRFRNLAIVGAVVGVGGWLVVSDVQATIHESDLTRIGNGVPTIVQIHDPDCQSCTVLQKEARAASKNFAEGELQFLVANLRNASGSQLAADNGVGRTTLLFFDGKGRRHEVMRGPHSREILEQRFTQFVKEIR